MKVFTPTSPDEALYLALHGLADDHVYSDSRNGPVLRFPGLVVTEWKNPLSRISWSPVRDANPFLHLIESFWMLAGRNDVELVAKLAPNMRNYSDDGSTLFGAYGHRWRRHFGHDQIAKIIAELKSNPTSRRCVLQMWDGVMELDRATGGGKDVCCNHAITFDPCDGVLNMTVSNRSNDMVWGAYGANVVHMSILHEYVAAQTGLKLGSYFQASSNLHLYLDLSPVMSKLASYQNGRMVVNSLNVDYTRLPNLQEPLFRGLNYSDREMVDYVNRLLESFMAGEDAGGCDDVYSLNVLGLMCDIFNCYKKDGAAAAVSLARQLNTRTHSYWLDAGVAWLMRRPSYSEMKAADV